MKLRHAGTLLMALAVATPLFAREGGAIDLKAGDEAPQFSLMGSDGRTHALDDNLGKRAIVIAWFPKAFTGG